MRSSALIFALTLTTAANAASVITFNATVERASIDYPSTIPQSERDFPISVGDQYTFRVLIDLDRPGGRSIYPWEDAAGTAPIYQAENFPTPSGWMKYLEYTPGQNIYHSALLDYINFGSFQADPYYVTSMVGVYSAGNRVYLVNRPFTLEDSTHSISDWLDGKGHIRFTLEMQEQHTVPFYVTGTAVITNVSSVPEPSSYAMALAGLIVASAARTRFSRGKSA